MKRLTLVITCLIILSLLLISCGAPLKIAREPVMLIVRGDDMGRTHASNLAFKKCFQEGILTCASIIVPSPWFEEAARMCGENPEWCIGIHLTLNAEWRDYRWKPVLPLNEVKSLVDDYGYFYPTTEAFLASKPNLEEVDRELRAQVNMALKRGIDVQYLDTHMGTARATPELRKIVLKICRDYDLPLSEESGEKKLSIYEIPPRQKEKALADELRNLDSGLWLLVVHPGLNTPEDRALVDANPEGLPNVAAHRAAVTKALTSKRIKKIIRNRGLQLIDYKALRGKVPLPERHE